MEPLLPQQWESLPVSSAVSHPSRTQRPWSWPWEAALELFIAAQGVCLLLQTGSTLFSQGLICTGGLYKQSFLTHFHTAGISQGKNVPVNTAAARKQQSWQQLRCLELGILGEFRKEVPKIQLQKLSRAAGCRQRRAIISFHAILLLLKKP